MCMKKFVYYNDDGEKITFVGTNPVKNKCFIFKEKEYYLIKVVIENV